MSRLQMFLYAVTLALATVYDQKSPIVTTLSGQVQGTYKALGFLHRHSFYSFKGIPYAEPPIGDLRFRSPIPHKGWTGVRDASFHGNCCPNNGVLGSGIFSGGREDCLFLNVYTPSLIGDLPVMIWIHPGIFYFGEGDDFTYGAEYLVREDVVVVTMNYRLAALGFLSTGDKNAPGNYGLKDIKLSIEWVKQNIRAFGGNPAKITLFGQSSGAVAIHYLLMANQQAKLFHQAIMMSGSALVASTFQSNPSKHAAELGHRLGLKFNSMKSLIEQLRKIDFREILRVETRLIRSESPWPLRETDFAPCLEPANSEEEILLSDIPEDFISNLNRGRINIPLIMGGTSNEGLCMTIAKYLRGDVFDDFNMNDDYFVPLSFNPSKLNSSSIKEVADKFREFYFKGENLSSKTLHEYTNFFNDGMVKFPIDRTLKYFARTSSRPIYYYNFSFDGAWNFVKSLTFSRAFPGVSHGDDLFYLFLPRYPIWFWPNHEASAVSRRYIRLFTNFAKHGNPTPTTDDLINVTWPQYNLENEPYLDIGEDLIIKYRHQQESLKMWHQFQKRFTGRL